MPTFLAFSVIEGIEGAQKIFLYSSGWSQTHNPSALVAQLLILQTYTIMPSYSTNISHNIWHRVLHIVGMK
jgi:hypothetical protein